MDVPDSVIHWLLGALVPLGGALFIFLLKRTFKEFEEKISTLFTKLETAVTQANEHNTKIQLLDQRVAQLEAKKRR